MTKNKLIKPVTLAISTLALSVQMSFAGEAKFIEPPMVNIPAGKFYMGSDRGEKDEQPVRQVSISAFQMGKYEVTVTEFEKFIKDTNYEMPNNCYQYVLGGPNREVLASWDTNIYNFSEFHPVVCLPQKAAAEYAKWLSEKTGKNYRLPTEAEWEYTLRAGTRSRHFFGEEAQANKSCEYANVSEWYAKNMSASVFPGAYVRDVEQCSDNEATLSMVGLYKPNPFGVYDLVGNVMEYLADCYVDNYQNAPTDGSAVITKDCKKTVVRGGSWHWKPWPSSQRGGMSDDFLGALEGFRLALDTGGKALPDQVGNKKFVKQLNLAQANVKAKHKQIPAYPAAPRGLNSSVTDKGKVILSWQENTENFVTGYSVYRQDPMTNSTSAIAEGIKTSTFIDKSPLKHNARYYVVALNNDTQSMSSALVDSGFITEHTLPAKVEGEAYSYAQDTEVKYSVLEPEDDKIINSMGKNESSYIVNIDKARVFSLDARVFHTGEDQQFEIWLGDTKLATPKLSGERGWKTIKDLSIELPAGKHFITVKGEQDMFAVNWLDFKTI